MAEVIQFLLSGIQLRDRLEFQNKSLSESQVS